MLGKLISIANKFRPVDGWSHRVSPDKRFGELDQQLHDLMQQISLSPDDFEWLAHYFMEGIDAYRSASFSSVLYPGVPGTRGLQVEGLEGFARGATILATWLHGGRPQQCNLSTGTSFDIYQHLRKGVQNGVDPASTGYWGDFENLDQRAVEAGDIALVFWILRDYAGGWSEAFKAQTIKWLDQINHVQLYGGNWFLFKAIVNTVLTEFGLARREQANESYLEFKNYYVGQGWFTDGKDGLLDYYNAWQMQYYLFWLREINPSLDADFLTPLCHEFCQGYQYLLSPAGIPIFGRSMPYRLAVATPLVIDSIANPQQAGIARRALDVTWRYFGSKGAIEYGTVNQGYFSARPELLENYSGRGSSLWSLRSLVMAFYVPRGEGIWQATPQPLPIETGDYEVKLEGPGISITGDAKTQSITVRLRRQFYRNQQSDQKIPPLALFRKVAQAVLRRPLRTDNFQVKYGRTAYSSEPDW